MSDHNQKKETALSYLRKAIDRSKSEGRRVLHINRKRLEHFSNYNLSSAINLLVDEGYLVSDHTQTTKPYNTDIESRNHASN